MLTRLIDSLSCAIRTKTYSQDRNNNEIRDSNHSTDKQFTRVTQYQSTTTGMQSTGRGGAGNITDAKSPKLTPADLQTPTLKTAVYSTGRGGSGNMAINADPVEARLAQDVEP